MTKLLFSATSSILLKMLLTCVAFSSASTLVFTQVPVITSLSTLSDTIGAKITIAGNNFSTSASNNIVYFGGVKAAVLSAAKTSLKVSVPAGAGYQPVSVTVNGLAASGNQPFLPTFNGPGGIVGQSMFGSKAKLPNNAQQQEIETADLNDDGKPEIISVGSSFTNNKISVYTNKSVKGNLSFTEAATYTVGQQCNAITVVDVDGDGMLDIVAAFTTDVVTILRNTSSGGTVSFAAGVTINGGPGFSNSIKAADLNGDGKPDLVLTSIYKFFTVIKNNSTPGNVVFSQPIQVMSSYGNANGLAIADFDMDGKPDVALSVIGSPALPIFRNSSTADSINFDSQTDISFGVDIGVLWPIAGDADDDGRIDLCVTFTGTPSFLGVFRNISTKGHISFEPEHPLLVTGTPLCMSDINGDGKAEIIAHAYTGFTVVNNKSTPGNINFENHNPYIPIDGTSNSSINATDLDGDGRADIIIANYSTAGDYYISVFRNSVPAGQHMWPAPVISSFSPLSAHVGATVTITGNHFTASTAGNVVYFGSVKAKVTAASATQIMVTVPPGATYSPITVTTNNLTAFSALPFTTTFFANMPAFMPSSFSKVRYDTVSAITKSIVSDIDGDGKADIVSTDTLGFSVKINTGRPGHISLSNPFFIASVYQGAQPLAAGDLDGDGKPDVVIGYSLSNKIAVYINASTKGHPAFNNPLYYTPSTGYFMHGVAIADLNNDGKPDIAVTCENPGGSPPTGTVCVFKNNSDSGIVAFSEISHFDANPNSRCYDIGIADFDGDGRFDIAAAELMKDAVAVYRNTGNFTFDTAALYNMETTGLAGNITLADFDNDGKTDMAVTNFLSDSLFVFKNNSIPGAISFTATELPGINKSSRDIDANDLDGDGKPDLAVNISAQSAEPPLLIYKNTTTGNSPAFAKTVNFVTGSLSNNITTGDLDGDGKPDIITANSGTIAILRNQTGEPLIIPSGEHPVSGDITTTLTIDSTVQAYNGNPYVQRHYDIQPANDASTATAKITLFFTQQDFDNFNAYPNHGPSLPTSPTDAAGIANILIYQYHGFSASSTPGTYSGQGIEINPADSNIIWNAPPEAGRGRYNQYQQYLIFP